MNRTKLMPAIDAAMASNSPIGATITKPEFLAIVNAAQSDGEIGGFDQVIIEAITNNTMTADAREPYENMVTSGLLVAGFLNPSVSDPGLSKAQWTKVAEYFDVLAVEED
jgi:hypothetical protein